ncbi:MAG: hypothetical protein IJX84_05785 [Clostridia bacterium]|nr:hypothetical protein [Clostridia bacterium]
MKKWLMLLLLLLPCCALAAPDTPYDPALMVYYPHLTVPQQQIFDLAYAGAAQGESRVELPDATAYDDACAALDALMLDCPELCALSGQYSVGYYRDVPQEAIYIDLSYTLPVESQQQLVQAASGLVEQARGEEFEREWFLHDALCQLVTYDVSAVNQHNAYGALVEGSAVCDGYAKAMALLLRLAGMEAGVAQGVMLETGASHAWNLVKVEGSYTWLDVTNDDQPDLTTYFYYNITDEWLARSHRLESTGLPQCDDRSVNWHVRNHRFVNNAEEMQKHIFNNFRNLMAQGSRFCLRFERESDYLSLRDRVFFWAIQYNKLFEYSIEGQLHSFYNDAQRCVIVQVEE